MSRYVIMDEDGTRVPLRQRQRRVLDPPSRTAHIERRLEPAHIGTYALAGSWNGTEFGIVS